MHKIIRTLWDVLWYIIVFLLVQLTVEMAAALIYSHVEALSFTRVAQDMVNGQIGWLLAVTSVVSSLITIILFTCCRWAPISRQWLLARPWATLCWVVLLTIGTILPAEWLYEKLQLQMPEEAIALFQSIMKEPWGYLAIGIFVPVAEELVFRGAILRTLLNFFNKDIHWVAIVLSAIIFGTVHMNMAQGIHAGLIGLLIGWMYYRTRSVIPGIVLHWVNNSVAYVIFNLMPNANDGKFIDLFHGDERLMYMGLGCSLMVLLPSLFQLAIRMKCEE
ncbi:MAG: CPBP family intramembrane metalloprotease [Prevotella sp.]|nr:CPBP family intramembrane metalloprotease [Prevotella sp.]